MIEGRQDDREQLVPLTPEYKPLPIQPEVLEASVTPVPIRSDYVTPAQEAAWSEPDVVEDPVPIHKGTFQPEAQADPQPFSPLPVFRTVTVPNGGYVLVTPNLPFRRVVTVLSLGDAAVATFTFKSRYTGESMLVVWSSDLPHDIPVFPGQELWVHQDTGVHQVMSFQVEPRGAGR